MYISEATKTVVLIVFAFAASVAIAGTTAAQTAGAPDCSTIDYRGDGTETTPYEVSDMNQLQCINSQGLGEHYRLVSDIDASGTEGWKDGKGFDPIGSEEGRFDGTFDAAGYNITSLTINRPKSVFPVSSVGRRQDPSPVGLFGVSTGNSTITNVTLEGVNITGGRGVGALVGKNEGGLVAHSNTSGQIMGLSEVGGLVGRNAGGIINDSHATGEVDGSLAGGLLGLNSRGFVVRSHATGDVSGGELVGGLVGFNDDGTVTKSYATGAVGGDELRLRGGGLVGQNSGWIKESYAKGRVKGDEGVGGLVGVDEGGTVVESYSKGGVDGDERVGGLVGVGGDGSVSKSYWDTETTGQSTSSGGVGLTTDEMTGDDAPVKMIGFGFGETWRRTEGYPRLAWQPEEDSEKDGDATNGGERLPGFTVVAALVGLVTGVAVMRGTKNG